jgi:hypothetical protein
MNAKLKYIGEDANVVGYGFLAKGQVIERPEEEAIPLCKPGGSFALVTGAVPPVQVEPLPTATEPLKPGKASKK